MRVGTIRPKQTRVCQPSSRLSGLRRRVLVLAARDDVKRVAAVRAPSAPHPQAIGRPARASSGSRGTCGAHKGDTDLPSFRRRTPSCSPLMNSAPSASSTQTIAAIPAGSPPRSALRTADGATPASLASHSLGSPSRPRAALSFAGDGTAYSPRVLILTATSAPPASIGRCGPRDLTQRRPQGPEPDRPARNRDDG